MAQPGDGILVGGGSVQKLGGETSDGRWLFGARCPSPLRRFSPEPGIDHGPGKEDDHRIHQNPDQRRHEGQSRENEACANRGQEDDEKIEHRTPVSSENAQRAGSLHRPSRSPQLR